MIRMIAKDLRINPLRTSLTALSMFIGIIALIADVLVGTLGRDYLEAVNARLGGKSPTYSAIVDVPSSVNIQVVTALQNASRISVRESHRRNITSTTSPYGRRPMTATRRYAASPSSSPTPNGQESCPPPSSRAHG